MKILSIDPSLTNTACIIWEDDVPTVARLIGTKPSKVRYLTVAEKDAERLEGIVRELTDLIDEHKPDMVLAEQSLGATQSAVATKSLGLVAGMMTTLASLKYGGAGWVFIRVHDVKRALVNKSHATKTEMVEAAAKVHPYLREIMQGERSKWRGDAEHYADATGVYVAYQRMGQTLKGGG